MLYVDITELVGWGGKLTGVPRVMDEICRRYSTRNDVVFVSWNPAGYLPTEFPVKTQRAKERRPLHIRLLYKIRKRSRIANKLAGLSIKVLSASQRRRQPQYIQLEKNDTLFVLADWHGGDPSFVKYLMGNHEKGVKLVQIVYDMLPIVTPQYSGHSTEMLVTYSLKVYPICDLIFAISKNTKADIELWLKENGLNSPRIEVFRLGDDFAVVKSEKPKAQLEGKFILCVGTIEARKNHTLLYYSYKLAAEQGIALPPLVIVGRIGWRSEDIYHIMNSDPQVSHYFKFLHSVSDSELAWLYQNCLFSIYPSFYEGWGLPIAESIAYGTPVIASNTSSMPEVAGDLIEYFSPASSEECLEAITKMLQAGNLRIAKSKINKYKPISWDYTFKFVNQRIGELHEAN